MEAAHRKKENSSVLGNLTALWKSWLSITAVLTLLLGAAVVLGWYLHLTPLIQIHPSLVPMQFNTALGFILCGLGLYGLGRDVKIGMMISGLLLSIIGILTLFQYLFDIALGIDELLMEHYITTKSSHPGRMAPTTAVSFILCSMSFIIASVKVHRKFRIFSIAIFAALILGLGLGTFLGYLIGKESPYGWVRLTYMAMHTAAAFILIGTALLNYAWLESEVEKNRFYGWIPLSVGIICFSLVIVFANSLRLEEEDRIRWRIYNEALGLADDISNWVDVQTQSLKRLSNRWHIRGGIPKDQWESDVSYYLTHFPSYESIQLIDDTLTLRWFVNQDGVALTSDAFEVSEENLRDLNHVRKSGQVVMSAVETDRQNRSRFFVYVPLYVDGVFDGAIRTVFHVDVMFQEFVKAVSYQQYDAPYTLFIKEDDREIYSNADLNNPHVSDWSEEVIVELHNRRWTLHIWPRPKVIQEMRSEIPVWSMFIGTIFTLLIVSMIILLQRMAQRTKEVQYANNEWEAESIKRNRAEGAYRLSQDQLNLTVEVGGIGIWNRYSNEESDTWNPNLLRLFGLDPDIVPYAVETLAGRIHPEDRERRNQVFDNIDSEDGYFEMDYRVVWPDNSFRILTERGQLRYGEDGQTQHIMSICWDITEAKQAGEQLLLAKQGAEEANKAKSRFLANMSHELRTPLNAIIGYSEMLIEDVEDQQSAADLQKIRGAGQHLLGLINDILDLSKVEAGKMDVVRERFLIAGLLENVESMVLPMIEKNGNRLRVTHDENIGSMDSDQLKLRQVLFNLLSNAAKFTKQDEIVLSVQRITEAGEDWLIFQVKDNGIGMNEAQLARVFDPFSQGDAFTTSKYGGTGLGLAICRGYCDLLCGELSVVSKEGQGSTFTVRVPARLPESSQVTNGVITLTETSIEDSTADVGIKDERGLVLVIDDDIEAQEVLNFHLRKSGWIVATAESGVKGLQMARELRPMAIILDVLMPEMDGWSVLQALKAEPLLMDIPVVMCTVVDEAQRGYTLGATDYLMKPVTRSQLAATLSRFCQSPPCHLLVVENDVATRELLCRTAEKLGWKVRYAENGKEALVGIAERQPDLIILDLMMPELDGFGVVEALQKHDSWRYIPVVVATAKELTEADHRRLNGYVEAIIKKEGRDLERLIQEVMQRLNAVVEK